MGNRLGRGGDAGGGTRGGNTLVYRASPYSGRGETTVEHCIKISVMTQLFAPASKTEPTTSFFFKKKKSFKVMGWRVFPPLNEDLAKMKFGVIDCKIKKKGKTASFPK